MMENSSGELDSAVRRLRDAPYDESAWATIYNVLWPYVYALAFRRLDGFPDVAQDVTQEVFVRLLRAGPAARFENSGALRAYLHIAAKRAVIDFIRSQHKHRTVHLKELTDDIPQPNNFEEDVAAQQSLEACLDQLGPSDQQMIRQLVGGLSINEIAEDLKISPGAARVRLHRLRRRLSEFHSREVRSPVSPEM